ncbi:DUF2268 domain-containing protein [Flammeovirga yaeyamensis]|uniref:DUF2268 domain-containing protein n=1 Tax=Flammeovirga yaeyamensis TaxID=367791 RepID=A0AAX1N988_9BACT|nr:DUF2268 domain-containing putative Zn-dependent protease [Flammeovirga yaeyamensis]MBB3699511.1 hypothetical protein [Flammeovirga yaeyamensis]NMF35233.1 hypothetical protein [Flammeovirga yaeyamensis]QWG04095.1 DUF2268 domain-containing protein [Flammeovirga yaeyamensis]
MKTNTLLLLLLISLSAFSKTSPDPAAPKLYTSDIENFYTAFDLVLKDTANANQIFKEKYFSVGTKGLKDFYKLKINDLDKFSRFIIKHQEFYKSIRKDITNIDDLKKKIYANNKAFKDIYPDAVFPDIYFVVGRFSSNGTISKRGLLIGIEILSLTEESDTEKWHQGMLKIIMKRDHIPVTVAHELVHFNQGKTGETTLLSKSLREGAAEFIAELICGETDGDYTNFSGKEQRIWEDFQKVKDEQLWGLWSSWVRESDERPRNAGYWTGYLICKSYYEQREDKSLALKEILDIKDSQEFYDKSKIEVYLKRDFFNK